MNMDKEVLMRELTELDRNILNIAKKMFLENGLHNTEMKDLAQRIGSSRSTLYRHFASKDEIVYFLATDAIAAMLQAQQIPEGFRFSTGYDAIAWQLNALVDELIHHVDDLIFLKEFDDISIELRKNTNDMDEFVDSAKSSTFDNPLRGTIEKGIQDGSIKKLENMDLFVYTIYHSCIALAQRVMPYEKYYIQDIGYGQEMLRCLVNNMLQLIKN